MDIKNYLSFALDAALKAGDRIMEIYNSNEFNIEKKADLSPVTTADFESSAIIYKMLSVTDIPVITEEIPIPDFHVRKSWEYLWMVDPLDGTKEFIKRNGEFTVNIGLIHNQVPVLGLIYIPVLHTMYYGANNYGSFKYELNAHKTYSAENLLTNSEKINTKIMENEIRIAVSRSHPDLQTQYFIDKIGKATNKKITVVQTGSSVKFCLVAEGSADIYLRFSPTMEWDTAAGQAIAINAGAKIMDKYGRPLIYNKPSLGNEGFYLSNAENKLFSSLF